jgi:hypothetical protein
MHGLFFDIGLGAGLAAACGMRPFLPLLLAGALASSSALDVSFAHEPFRFLSETWWLLVVAVALVVSYAAQLLLSRSTPSAGGGEQDARRSLLSSTNAGLGIGSGVVVFAGTLAAHHELWWPGALAGGVCAALSESVVERVVSGARARLTDRSAREALTVYLDAASLALAAAVCVLHPLGYLVVAALAWFALRVRARAGEKYAGLRVLRR